MLYTACKIPWPTGKWITVRFGTSHLCTNTCTSNKEHNHILYECSKSTSRNFEHHHKIHSKNKKQQQQNYRKMATMWQSKPPFQKLLLCPSLSPRTGTVATAVAAGTTAVVATTTTAQATTAQATEATTTWATLPQGLKNSKSKKSQSSNTKLKPRQQC